MLICWPAKAQDSAKGQEIETDFYANFIGAFRSGGFASSLRVPL